MTLHFREPLATYIHIPKAGGQSFRDWARLRVNNFEYGPEHGTLNAAKIKWGNLGTTFTFVRNPYDRLVSIYFYSYARRSEVIASMQASLDYTVENRKKDREKLYNDTFSRGFDWWINSLYYEPHEFYLNESFPFLIFTPPQVTWFSGDEIDIVIKLEDIKEEFPRIQKMFNVSARLEKLNSTKHESYDNYYTSSSKAIAEKLYEQDLNKFNYDF